MMDKGQEAIDGRSSQKMPIATKIYGCLWYIHSWYMNIIQFFPKISQDSEFQPIYSTPCHVNKVQSGLDCRVALGLANNGRAISFPDMVMQHFDAWILISS